MTQKFVENGYEIIEENDEIQVPDICIINTCTVTNMSDRKSRQMLRRVKEKNKNTIVVTFLLLLAHNIQLLQLLYFCSFL